MVLGGGEIGKVRGYFLAGGERGTSIIYWRHIRVSTGQCDFQYIKTAVNCEQVSVINLLGVSAS